MPDSLNGNGLNVATLNEITQALLDRLNTLYGSSVSIESSTPDSQMIYTFAQSAADARELLLDLNSSFDPSQAVGLLLDQRCAWNGIFRKGGTFTTTNVSVVIDRPLTLYGTDQSQNTIFTVRDNNNQNWFLVNTIVLSTAGVTNLLFRAEFSGEVTSNPNTITNIVTVVLGVVSVNNPLPFISLGIPEESDESLRQRRDRSTAAASYGALSALESALLNVNSISYAKVYNNPTDAIDSNDIPPHAIWVIVAGSASVAVVTNIIYGSAGTAGAGYKGTQSQLINNTIYRFDYVLQQNLFVMISNIASIDGVNIPNYAQIKNQIVNNLNAGVNEPVTVNQIGTLMQQADANAVSGNILLGNTISTITSSILRVQAANYQFEVLPQNIILLPILISPQINTAIRGQIITFSAIGGYSNFAWSFVTNQSGGTITPAGVYTAGNVSGTDVIKVVDSFAPTPNQTTINVVVS